MRKIIVTRHPALLQFLTECGEVDEGTAVLAHVSDPRRSKEHMYMASCRLTSPHVAARSRQ